MVIVRNALASDAEAILAFCQQIGSETDNLSYGEEGVSVSVADEGNLLNEIQKSKTSHFLVAEEAGEIVGTCNCSAFRKKRLAHRTEIGIAVKKAYWDQGIGCQLLTRLIAAAQRSGLKVLSLEVRLITTERFISMTVLVFKRLERLSTLWKLMTKLLILILWNYYWRKND